MIRTAFAVAFVGLIFASLPGSAQAAVPVAPMHGIANPTADQIRIAMFGGTIVPPSGPTIVMPGVVPGAGAAPSAAIGGGAPVVPPRTGSPIVTPGGRPVVPSR